MPDASRYRLALLGLALAVLVVDLWTKQWAIDSLANAVHPMVVGPAAAGADASIEAAFADRGVEPAELREAAATGQLAWYGRAVDLRADRVLQLDDLGLDLVATEGTGLAAPRRLRVHQDDVGRRLGVVAAEAWRVDEAEIQGVLDQHTWRRSHPVPAVDGKLPADAVVALRERQIPVVEGFMSFVYAENFGAAWGFLREAPPLVRFLLFALISLIASVAMIWAIWTGKMGSLWSSAALAAVLGGAVGNLVDRVRFRAVVDFIYNYVVVGGETHSWPVYNVADIGISVGVVMIALEMLFRREPQQQSAPARANASGERA